MFSEKEKKDQSKLKTGRPVSVHHVDELPPRVGEYEVLDGSLCVIKDVLIKAGKVDSTSVGRRR